ncbi:hypothetical protein [Mycobacterium sp. E3339]|uniref:hypothetical protein n=1 Tax=Mycobacterium sp. E3339 TaxID=1834146 RepID=UPI0007FE023D|nr:hypothetical protein [Mycobacterium sp. E3339]OBG63125.1 hypothetical protein A5702_23345 [Mycobacterium sp. E3339]
MPAALRICEVCETTFHGRTDALYCSTACKQQAYRQRARSAPANLIAVPHGGNPVPHGDTWMGGRFGGLFGDDYATLAVVANEIAASVKTPAARQKRLTAAEENAAQVIENYVGDVAAIGRSTDEGFDFETPLGGALPATIDADLAHELATRLQAALPRLVELASLLIRRSINERIQPVENNEVCTVHSTDCVRQTSTGEPYCIACDYMLFL